MPSTAARSSLRNVPDSSEVGLFDIERFPIKKSHGYWRIELAIDTFALLRHADALPGRPNWRKEIRNGVS